MGPVPLVDLAAQHEEVRDHVAAGLARVLGETSFVSGKDVALFEDELAGFWGVEHIIGVANGTDAIELALRAADVGSGKRVAIPANTFIATAEAVWRAGATPVFVDVDPLALLMDPVALARMAVRGELDAVIPVHLYGQMARMEEITAVAEDAGLVVIEDAAQCQGATRHGRPAGSMSMAAATSFYPGKNLGAYGDAGAVVTSSSGVAARVRSLSNHGSVVKYEHEELGMNSRLDTVQAVVLRAKLARLAEWNERRRAAAACYDQLLVGTAGLQRPVTLPGNEHVWHLYVIQVDERDRVLQRLNERGIGAGVHYPIPCHLQGAFRSSGYGVGDFPVAERAARRILSLPLYPHITAAQQERVVEELDRAMAA